MLYSWNQPNSVDLAGKNNKSYLLSNTKCCGLGDCDLHLGEEGSTKIIAHWSTGTKVLLKKELYCLPPLLKLNFKG